MRPVRRERTPRQLGKNGSWRGAVPRWRIRAAHLLAFAVGGAGFLLKTAVRGIVLGLDRAVGVHDQIVGRAGASVKSRRANRLLGLGIGQVLLPSVEGIARLVGVELRNGGVRGNERGK